MTVRMTKIERVLAVVNGQRPDRPPVSFWHHFGEDQRRGEAAVSIHLKFLDRHDLDFLKVMYDLGYPHPASIQSVRDLSELRVLNGDEGVFGEHLATIRALASELTGRVVLTTTIFNAWGTLRRLMTQGPYVPGAGTSPIDDPKTVRVVKLASEDRAAVGTALRVIGESLANFARRCIEAGADGIFLSCRDDWVGPAVDGVDIYDEYIRPADHLIMSAAADGRFNVLHVCGKAVDFARFAEYPMHVINWADRTAGPLLRDVVSTLKPAPAAGVDHVTTMPSGTPDQCAAEVRDAVTQAGDRPIIIAPGCTYDPARVPPANLAALRQAVDQL